MLIYRIALIYDLQKRDVKQLFYIQLSLVTNKEGKYKGTMKGEKYEKNEKYY